MTNDECQMTKEARNPKLQRNGFFAAVCCWWRLAPWDLRIAWRSSFGHSSFLRHSSFVIRHCSAALLLIAAHPSLAATNALTEEPIPRLRPPRGEIPPTFWEQNGIWIILAGVVLLGVIAFIAWWLLRPKPVVAVPPDVQARSALESLRQKPEDGAALSQVSQILRHYVNAAFGLPPGEMTTADFCQAVADQGRLGAELSAALADFLRKCDERKFAPPSPVAAGILPAVEGGILPPGTAPESFTVTATPTPIPPGRMPGSTAGCPPLRRRAPPQVSMPSRRH